MLDAVGADIEKVSAATDSGIGAPATGTGTRTHQEMCPEYAPDSARV